jgi:hypothetical protein
MMARKRVRWTTPATLHQQPKREKKEERVREQRDLPNSHQKRHKNPPTNQSTNPSIDL